MRAHTTLILDGEAHLLGHGDFIGRLPSAALVISDPGVSEAHALVSLRADTLCLLGLRGPLTLDGERRGKVVLEAGQQIGLADGVMLDVAAVTLPDRVMALEGEGLGRVALSAVNSLVIDTAGRVDLLPRYSSRGQLWLWCQGDTWLVRTVSAPQPMLASDGQEIVLGDRQFRLTTLPLARSGGTSTMGPLPAVVPLTIESRYNTVHIQQAEGPMLVISGNAAKLIAELAAFEVPVEWLVVAGEIWGDMDATSLRRRWDMCLWRLRAKLREAGLRDDLVRSDYGGNVELVLSRNDTLTNLA